MLQFVCPTSPGSLSNLVQVNRWIIYNKANALFETAQYIQPYLQRASTPALLDHDTIMSDDDTVGDSSCAQSIIDPSIYSSGTTSSTLSLMSVQTTQPLEGERTPQGDASTMDSSPDKDRTAFSERSGPVKERQRIPFGGLYQELPQSSIEDHSATDPSKPPTVDSQHGVTMDEPVKP